MGTDRRQTSIAGCSESKRGGAVALHACTYHEARCLGMNCGCRILNMDIRLVHSLIHSLKRRGRILKTRASGRRDMMDRVSFVVGHFYPM